MRSELTGGLSRSARAPRVTSASSSSVMASSERNALARASPHTLPWDLLDIVPDLLPFSLAQAVDPDVVAAAGEHQHMQPHANEAQRPLAQFAVILANLDLHDGRLPLESSHGSQADAVDLDVGLALRFVP